MRILCIGAGSMGRRRLRDLTHLNEGNVILFEPDAQRCREIAAAFGVTGFTNLDDALGQKPDALSISTPPALHEPYVRNALERKLHVFAEVPFILDAETYAQIAAQTLEYPAVLAPSHSIRYYPPYRLIHDLLQKKSIGRPLYLEYSLGNYLPDWHPYEDYQHFYASDVRLGGAGMDMILHEVSAMQRWLGNVESVYARLSKLSSLEIQGPDSHDVLLTFANGACGFFHNDLLERGSTGRHIRIVGTRARSNGIRICRWSVCIRPRTYNKPRCHSRRPAIGTRLWKQVATWLAFWRASRPARVRTAGIKPTAFPMNPAISGKCDIFWKRREGRSPIPCSASLMNFIPSERFRPLFKAVRSSARSKWRPDTDGDEGEMVIIPGGSVRLGVPGCPANTVLPHRWVERTVTVPAFGIGRHPVTIGEYLAFARDSGYAIAEDLKTDKRFENVRAPAAFISWIDAVRYCQGLSRKTGRPYRLVRDAEYEKAARGGLEGMRFPWGNEPPDGRADWGNPNGSPKPVGSFAPNGYGLYDMVGSIWSWCEECFEQVVSPDQDRASMCYEDTLIRDVRLNPICRGGSFKTADATALHCAYRHEDPSEGRFDCIGFRVALSM